MYEIDWCETPCVQISVITEAWEGCWWYCNKKMQLYQGATRDFHSPLPSVSCLQGIGFMALFSAPIPCVPMLSEVKGHLPSLATANFWATHLTIQRKDVTFAWGGNKWRKVSSIPAPRMEQVLLPPQAAHSLLERTGQHSDMTLPFSSGWQPPV